MNKSLWVRRAHRWLGLIFSLAVVTSAGSGILHQVMTRTQSAPPSVMPKGEGWDAGDIQVTVREAVSRLPNPGQKLTAVSIRQITGEPWYQIFRQDEKTPHYVNAATGEPDSGRDEIYAAEIASRFLGAIPVRKTDYLTAFNTEYLNIFRILPVYRFDADDGKETRVYVSTMTGSVTRHTDKKRQFEAGIFSNFHKLAFIPNKDIRDLVLVGMTGGVLLAGIAGLALFFMTGFPRRR